MTDFPSTSGSVLSNFVCPDVPYVMSTSSYLSKVLRCSVVFHYASFPTPEAACSSKDLVRHSESWLVRQASRHSSLSSYVRINLWLGKESRSSDFSEALDNMNRT